MHQALADINAPELCDLEPLLGAFHPDRLNAVANGIDNPLPRIVLRGWEAMAQLLPSICSTPLRPPQSIPAPWQPTLRAAGTALLHADPCPVNIALCNDQVVLLDWGLATAGPGARPLPVPVGRLRLPPRVSRDRPRRVSRTRPDNPRSHTRCLAVRRTRPVRLGQGRNSDHGHLKGTAPCRDGRPELVDRPLRAALELGHVPARGAWYIAASEFGPTSAASTLN